MSSYDRGRRDSSYDRGRRDSSYDRGRRERSRDRDHRSRRADDDYRRRHHRRRSPSSSSDYDRDRRDSRHRDRRDDRRDDRDRHRDRHDHPRPRSSSAEWSSRAPQRPRDSGAAAAPAPPAARPGAFRELRVPPVSQIPAGIVNLVDKVAAAVAQGGTVVEDELRDREARNPHFAFLFAPQTDDIALYYRWRVYSLTQGDNFRRWNAQPFTLVSGDDVVWYPPPLPTPTAEAAPVVTSPVAVPVPVTVPVPLAVPAVAAATLARPSAQLPPSARDEWIRLVRAVKTPDRQAIAAATRHCVNHALYAEDSLTLLAEDLRKHTITATFTPQLVANSDALLTYESLRFATADATFSPEAVAAKRALCEVLGRLFLLSDVLNNGYASGNNGAALNIIRAAEGILRAVIQNAAGCIINVVRATNAVLAPEEPSRLFLIAHTPLHALVGWIRVLWAQWKTQNIITTAFSDELERSYGWLVKWATAPPAE